MSQNVETPVADEATTVAYSSETVPSAAAPTARPSLVVPGAATGRRKEAVARVRIFPGTGKWTVNGLALETYFPDKVHQQHINEPFTLLGLVGAFDVIARIDGGGFTGQAGALRLGIARCLNAMDTETNRPSLKKARKAPQFSKR